MGQSHRNHQARALLQEQAAHIFSKVASQVKYPDNLMLSGVKELIRGYSAALKHPHEAEAIDLATATKLNAQFTAEALVLAKASILSRTSAVTSWRSSRHW
jgi:hypothetical protein